MNAVGSITKRKLTSGKLSWGFSFFAGRDEAGKRIQVTRSGFSTRKAAATALAAAVECHQQGLAVVKDGRSFGEFLRTWLDDHAGRRVTPKSLESYRLHVSHMTKALGDTPLAAITPAKLEKALWNIHEAGGRTQDGKTRPLSARTVRHIGFTMHAAFADAVRLGVMDLNPMQRVQMPKAVIKRPEALSREDVVKLLAAAQGTVLYPIIALALATGARRGELLALEWSDVDFDKSVLAISKSIEQTKAGVRVKSTKSGKPRLVALPASAVAILSEHREDQAVKHLHSRKILGEDFHETNLVFCTPDGALYRPDRVGARVCELAQTVGLKAGLHTLRHQHASESLSAGVPLPAVSARLGHANPAITSAIYSHALGEDARLAADQWDKQFGGILKQKPARC